MLVFELLKQLEVYELSLFFSNHKVTANGDRLLYDWTHCKRAILLTRNAARDLDVVYGVLGPYMEYTIFVVNFN